LLLLAFMIAVDPYDTGKFGLLGIAGVDDRDTHTATASRARDASFDSAVIGNSTAQLLDPAELSRATGLRFVQLYLTGGNPRGQTFTSVYWIYQNSFIFFKLGYGSALSIILMLIILVLASAQIAITRRRSET